MPSRVSARVPMAMRASNKSSTQTPISRTSTTCPATVIPQETPETVLRLQICNVFSDAQKTTAGHRKLVVNLRKIQENCVYQSAHPRKENCGDFNEDDFNVEIARCMIRMMSARRSEGVGDRLIRFLGLFLRHASEKDAALSSSSDTDEVEILPETATTRLTSHILSILLQLLSSKEKTVRYRATQLVAHIINSLDSIDDEYYHLLKVGLLKRIRDKEPMIRVQAVLGLGRLAGNEDQGDRENDDSDNDTSSGLLERLLDALQNDPSAEVRRSLLLNLQLTPSNLPYLLERARDHDPATRRALYSRLLPALGDFRHLSLSMREKLLRWGLRDRDENVRNATARLFRERWIEDCATSREVHGEKTQAEETAMNTEALLELLERIDVVNSGVEEGIAREAMKEFWSGRPDYQKTVSFDHEFWEHLSPESVFVARTFNDHSHQQGDGAYETMAGEKMPEVTKIAFILERYTNRLIECLRQNHERHEGDEEEDIVEHEFVVEQLLHIAKTLDYSDEVGRRKMFSLLRETLAIAELPDEITKLIVDVLRDVCGVDGAGEKDFCGVVLEAVAEVHDAITTDEPSAEIEDSSFHSARSELSYTTFADNQATQLPPGNRSTNEVDDEAKAIREIMVNMKCLHMAQCMLQNVEGELQHDVHLISMLNNLVVPAVRSHEAPIRERGLLCLGLYCLLDKNLAEENLTLFLHCFHKGHNALQVTAIHVLTDILTTHPYLLVAKEADENVRKSVVKVFAKGMKAEHVPELQSAAITALCKLMLTSIIHDEDLLKQAVVCYFNPITKENAGVRQALSYFLPVYCHSRRDNMQRMANITVDVMQAVMDLSEELEEGDEMVGISLVGNMLVDWTDARKLVVQDETASSWDEAGKKEMKAVNGDIHLSLAHHLLERVMYHGCAKEGKKALIAMLGKLYITASSSAESLQKTMELVVEAIDDKVASDAASRNALSKLHSALSKVLDALAKARETQDDIGAPVDIANLTKTNPEIEELGLADEEDIKMETGLDDAVTGEKDSLLDESLNEDDDSDNEDL